MILRAHLVAIAAAALLAAAICTEALAHRLNVFASVQDGVIVVEAKFANGKKPTSGAVEIFNGADKLIATYELASNGELRVPLADLDASTGLRILVKAGEHHENYWILTPDDIKSQSRS